MGDYRKVLRTKWVAICNNCNHQFELTDEWMREKEERDGYIPLSAKSSSTNVFCPKCNTFNFRLSFDYQNLYKRRCPKCGEMFETAYSWEEKCPTCVKNHAEILATMGPG